MSNNGLPKLRGVGSRAVELYWDGDLLKGLLNIRHAIALAIEERFGTAVVVNEGYQTLLVLIAEESLAMNQLKTILAEMLNGSISEWSIQPSKWRLPVYYDVKAEDLLMVAQHSTMEPLSVVELHTTSVYTVDFLGFLPGFPYLSGLSDQLNIPRKKTPSRAITSGSVAIAAGQCGIYPWQSPGGWYVLGQSPLNYFDVQKATPSFLEIGDTIEFYAINETEFESLSQQDLDPKTYLNG